MKLHILSDLHNEFALYTPHSGSKNADVIVLAGDIWKGARGIHWARQSWPHQHIVYIAGNHEFYGQIRSAGLEALRAAALDCSVHFLENDEVIIDGIRFLGATLWTDFELFGIANKLRDMKIARDYLNDFRRIQEDPEGVKFSPSKSIDLHSESVDYLKSQLNHTFIGKTVVVTHHLPSIKSVSKMYINDPLSSCFASNLDYLFGKSELWIHGHTHDSCVYEINKTKVICNPHGYSSFKREIENYHFNSQLIVEL